MTEPKQLSIPKEPRTRQCEVCGLVARWPVNGKPIEKGHPIILAINLTVYLARERGKYHLATSKRVRVCEGCLVPIVASQMGAHSKAGRKLTERLFDRIAETYRGICEAES